MRMRTRSHLDERIAACEKLIMESFDTSFSGGMPLHIEIGCGKGRFITETAKLNPDIKYIAVEKVSNVIVLAMEKAAKAELENLKFMRGNFQIIAEDIPDKSVDRIYLNFSDPWPKKGYAKRRLTHGGFLEIYKRILKDDGEICFKTDNRELFDFSLESFPENGFTLSEVTFDLHNSGFEGNIMTEYEERFSQMGTPICRLVAKL
ncbi:MAG: tRNA (guanosine(46)-N7)-methyltransferase TrmB [Clostridia bacterium]|nr:tRNA (guanosine(46)-N7)-methyltransferase TrmB [Clostridia bacterium]